MDIWQACKESFAHQVIGGQLVRVVESQEQVATNNLVETLDEQYLLEQMLESNKPGRGDGERRLHYLLATPFRYPPLKYGSRFGKKSEPSLLYGSKKVGTALAEAAYYRFVFWQGMDTAPASKKFVTQHTLWGAKYYTTKGIALHQPPFDEYREQLTAFDDYRHSQMIGSRMRKVGTEAFEFISARDTGKGLNVALFTPNALATNLPDYQQQWLCETNRDEVVFYSANDQAIYQFNFNQFLVNEKFFTPSVS